MGQLLISQGHRCQGIPNGEERMRSVLQITFALVNSIQPSILWYYKICCSKMDRILSSDTLTKADSIAMTYIKFIGARSKRLLEPGYDRWKKNNKEFKHIIFVSLASRSEFGKSVPAEWRTFLDVSA